MNEAKPTPQLKHIEQISDGWLKKYILHYELPGGKLIRYESISRKTLEGYRRELERSHDAQGKEPRPDAVCIIPRTEEDELVLIREFRYPLNSWCVSFPAGLLEENEDILSCIQRELFEETGYRVLTKKGQSQYHPLSQAGYSSIGMSEENVLIAYAYVEKYGEHSPEPSEYIETFTLAIDDISRFLEENTEAIGTRCQLILESFVHERRWTSFKSS